MTSQDAGIAAKPKKIMPRWQRIAWGGFGLIMIATGLTQVFHGLAGRNELPECDSQGAKDTLSDVFKEQKLSPTSYGEIKTISSSKDEVVCHATLPAGDQGNLDVDYTFFRDGSAKKIRYSIKTIPK